MRKTIVLVGLGVVACSSSGPVATSEVVPAVAPVPKPEPSFWGPAPPLADRIEVFEAVADDLAATYVFSAANMDWAATRPLLRARIERAETYGEFFRVFSDLSRGLGDAHNTFASTKVCETPLADRPPLLRGFRGTAGSAPRWLGVCGTALADDSVLIYRVVDENPAGLKPGDRVVGFDGTGLRTLLEGALAKLPYCGTTAGNSKTDDHLMIATMIYNPHLYKAMDVVRAGNSDAQSIATDSLLDSNFPNFGCNDQLATAIPFPWSGRADVRTRSPVSSGILPGTNTGYIYVYGWIGDVEKAFLQAVTSLLGTSGLIIDTRFNVGGNMFLSFPTLRVLFNRNIDQHFHIAVRADPGTQEMRVKSDPYNVKVDPATHYDQPIAILTGPQAVSSGDDVAYLLAAHPRARRFGRPTNGSGCSTGGATVFDPEPKTGDLIVRRTPCISLDRDKKPFSGAGVEPEVDVWLTQPDVIAGRDTVVHTALEWIAKENAASPAK